MGVMMKTWALVVCIIRACGPLPPDPGGRDQLILSELPAVVRAAPCNDGISACKVYHQKAIGNGWIEIVR
jgi:hypothetical protein